MDTPNFQISRELSESMQNKYSQVMNKIHKTAYYWIWPLLIIYMEIIVKISSFGEATWEGLLYTSLFSVSIGLGFAFLSSLGNQQTNWMIARILLGILYLFGSAQIVYYSVFETFGTLYSLFVGAGAITEFWSGTVQGIVASLPPLISLLIPFLAFFLFGKRITPSKDENRRIWKFGNRALLLLAGTLGFHLIAFSFVYSDTDGIQSTRYLYRNAFIPTLSVSKFGIISTLRLDALNLVFHDLGGNESLGPEIVIEEEPPIPEPVKEYGFNVTQIDFDQLISGETDDALLEMHQYFKSIVPTKQNEYTGLFQGKNLIWIVGEAFSSLALNEEVTPTLSRMAEEGFVFSNFYNPIWSVSTSDGEYVTLTGLIPKSGVWSFQKSADNYLPYAFGNQLSQVGYTCKAYHNHYYQYYDRHLSHPNMGYDYKGLGNGLAVTETWPESDLEMMELTIPKDLASAPFHTYYLTVSGHLNYTFGGNAMATRHRDLVKDLPYSEGGKAYLACNVELDLAMEYLIEQLTAAGMLEDTVIVLSGDHYPYGLTDGEMDELAGYELEKKFEKYKSTLIVWSGSIKQPIYVEKVCSSLDVMPTLANLFGLSYDSRLLVGQDILSDSPGLVEFGDRSFITDQCRYDAKSDTFTPNNGESASVDDARETIQSVNNSFYFSAKILEEDYYERVLGP